MNSKILIIDDDKDNLVSTSSLLEEWGYEVTQADNANDGIKLGTDPNFAVILQDYRMPDKNGAEIAAAIKQVNRESIILMYSCDNSREALKESWAIGVNEFVDKDIPLDKFKEIIEKYCIEYEEYRRTVRYENSRSAAETVIRSVGMVGRSKVLADVARKILKYQDSNETVLLIGESGVGKENVAQALHRGREDKFKSFNCSSYAGSNTMESELFGHEKGAFTGALTSKIGILESAAGGTAFFDELHQLDIPAQAKLLRAFQNKKIRRVGGRDEYTVDFRIVAAVQTDIEERIEKGLFQFDLYQRINILRIEIPPLRSRPEDIEPLVAHFCEQFFKQNGIRKTFLASTIRSMENYSWPGNVRELEHMVRRLLTDVSSNLIEAKHLEKKIFKSSSTVPVLELSTLKLKHFNEVREWLLLLLKVNAGSAIEAAKRAQIPTSTFYDMLAKHQIEKKRISS